MCIFPLRVYNEGLMSMKGEAEVVVTFNPSPAVLDLSTSKTQILRSGAEQSRVAAFWQLDTSCSKRVIFRLIHERPNLVLPYARPQRPHYDAMASTHESLSL